MEWKHHHQANDGMTARLTAAGYQYPAGSKSRASRSDSPNPDSPAVSYTQLNASIS